MPSPRRSTGGAHVAGSTISCASASAPASSISSPLPAFARGDENENNAAWEGGINAATGVYTDIPPLASLIGGNPVYSAIPMASAYGGILGALSASLGLFDRQRNGRGQRIEVPLADAVMSAMALLIVRMEGQPQRYNYPPINDTMIWGT